MRATVFRNLTLGSEPPTTNHYHLVATCLLIKRFTIYYRLKAQCRDYNNDRVIIYYVLYMYQRLLQLKFVPVQNNRCLNSFYQINIFFSVTLDDLQIPLLYYFDIRFGQASVVQLEVLRHFRFAVVTENVGHGESI